MNNFYPQRIKESFKLSTSFALKALGVLFLFMVWSIGAVNAKTWYVINNVTTGELEGWQNPSNWTEDPAAQVYSNPEFSIPASGDDIVVRQGKEITLPAGFVVNAGTVTVDGILYIAGATDMHTVNALRGSGRVYIAGNNLPTGNLSHFTSEGPGAGTLVFYGDGPITVPSAFSAYNLEVDMSGNDKSVTLVNNVTVNGSLNVKRGRLIMDGTTSRTLEVKKNIHVQTNGFIGVSNSEAYHNLVVWGDFKNYGSVKLSNAPQYNVANNGAVRLTFKGASNNDFVVNGSTQVYRLFVEKGDNDFYTLSVVSNNVNNFKLMGPYARNFGVETSEAGLQGWEKLPLVIRKGTLKLGANIKIDRLGYNRNGGGIAEFHVPAGAALWVNGAELQTAVESDYYNGAFENSGLSLEGKLRISAGSLTTPNRSEGIGYRGLEIMPSELIVEGGLIKTTQLRSINDVGYLNYSQSAGVIDFYARTGAPEKSPVFNLPFASQVFEMSGGEMIFRVANQRGQDSHGIQVLSDKNNCNITGGTVKIYTPTQNDFQILSLAPFYNIEVLQGAGNRPVVFREHWVQPKELYVLNTLTVASGTTVNAGENKLFLGGDLTLNGSLLFSTGIINLIGDNDATLTNNTNNLFTIPTLQVVKNSIDATVSLAGNGNFSVGNLTLTRGDFDLYNKNLAVTNSVGLFNGSLVASNNGFTTLHNGVELTSLSGKDNSFGHLKINSGANITLMSNAKAQKVDFIGNGIFNLDEYNLEIEEANYALVSGWGTSKMFQTAGNASDGGLTLGVEFDGTNGIKQLFPMGSKVNPNNSTLGYYPTQINAINNPVSSGTITIQPVNNYHPAVNNPSRVLQYYWRTATKGFDDLSNGDFNFVYNHSGNIQGSINKAIVLYTMSWVEYGNRNGSAITFPYMQDYSSGDYTVGNQSAFKDARVLYSINSGNFNSYTTWSDVSHTGAALPHNKGPEAFDYYIIAPNHTVTINQNNARGAQVEINGVLQVAHNTQGHEIRIIKGEGRLKFINNHNYIPYNFFIRGDYVEFANNPNAVVEFAGSGNYHMPDRSVIPVYPSIHVSGGGTKRTPYNGSVYINGELFVDNANFGITGVYAGELRIAKNLRINAGTLQLSPTNTHHTYVGGDLILDGATGVLRGGADNNLYLSGNILQNNGSIAFDNANRTNIHFTGDNSAEFISQVAPAKSSFYAITIDKSLPDTVVHFKNGFVFDGGAQPLKLVRGVAHLDNSTIDVILNSSTVDFKIPSASKLIVDNGATVRSAGPNSSLFLDGALVVDNGGKFLWEGAGGNHLKYSASGSASIWIGNNAKFYLGSQLFRNSEGGILSFTQANASSDVKIATVNAPLQTKGVFEILNEGSSFTQTQQNSVITILSGQSGANPVPSIIFNPQTNIIAKGSKFVVGDSGNNNKITLYAEQTVGALDIIGNSNVELIVSPLKLNGSLNIGAGSTFVANNLDVTIKGDLQVDGVYQPGINTTYFAGAGNQQINGTVDFYNLSKITGTQQLTIDENSDIQVTNNLFVERGTVATGNNNLVVKGNATVLLNAAIGGVELNGDILQLLAGGGNIDRLIIDNAEGVMVPSQPDAVSVVSKLVLAQGIFDIGSSLLELGKSAEITDGNGGSNFSEANMIQTFLSFTDAGVRKYFNAITAPTTFVYPIGSQSKYTPVTFVIDEITNSDGYIRVKAANERHVSVIDNAETAMIEPDNVLKYYWTVDAKDIKGFKAKVNMQAYAQDVAPPAAGEDYIVARILANNNLWNKVTETAKSEAENIYFDHINSQLIFNGYFFNGTDDIGISGDYTAGLEEAIPEKVPTYISVEAGGAWNDKFTWAEYNPETKTIGAAGENVQENGPFGSIVYIRENVNMQNNGSVAYRTYIEAGGTLNVGSTINNRLGDVYGKGRIRVEGSSIPAGFYESFVSADGGTFEYSGTGNYFILGGINIVNNLELTGSGERKFHDGVVRLYGNLLVNGNITADLQRSTELQVGKNITFESGNIDMGVNSMLVLNGSSPQTIGGSQSYTGTNVLQNVHIDNSSGVVIASDMLIDNHLQLDHGKVTLSNGATLKLGAQATTAGASSASYVNAPLIKTLSGYESFEFPVGNENRYGAFTVKDNNPTGGDWIVKYYNAAPPSRDQKDNVAYISNNEYWEVTGPFNGASGFATLRWDDESGINPNAFDVVTFEPQSANPVWKAAQKNLVDISARTVSIKSLAHSTVRYYSFGLKTAPTAADYTWKGLNSTNWFDPSNWYGGQVPSAATPVLITTVDIVQPTYWPVIDGSSGALAQVNNLIIESGTTLTLEMGGRLTVNGDLTNSGEFVLKNTYGPDGLTSLITHGVVVGEAKVEFTLPSNKWYYLSSPMQEVNYNHFGAEHSNARVNIYRNKWIQYAGGATSPQFQGLEGASTYFETTTPEEVLFSYTGELNTAPVSRELKARGYYLFGNPYPAAINWQDENWERERVFGTVWYRTRVNNEMGFVTYNRFAVPGARVAMYPDGAEIGNEDALALIPPYQSVWVYSRTASAASPVTLTVTPDQRVHGALGATGFEGGMLKSSKVKAKPQADIVRIVVQNSSSRDGTVIYFSGNATDEFDDGDSPKYFNGSPNIPEVYTRSAGQNLAINGLAPFEGAMDLPISVRNRVEGEVTMKFDLSKYYTNDIIVLHDRYLDTKVNLRKNNEYTYEPTNLGDDHERFVIQFNPTDYKADVSVSIFDEINEEGSSKINIVGMNGRAIVSISRDLLADGAGLIEVYSIEGVKLDESEARTNKTFLVLPDQAGVYVVVVSASGERKVKKLMR